MSTPVKIKLVKEADVFGKLQKIGTEFEINKDMAQRLVGKGKAVYVVAAAPAQSVPKA
jgi:hypothetical protein